MISFLTFVHKHIDADKGQLITCLDILLINKTLLKTSPKTLIGQGQSFNTLFHIKAIFHVRIYEEAQPNIVQI